MAESATYVASLPVVARMFRAENAIRELETERDMREAWNKRLCTAVDDLLTACVDTGSPIVPTPVAEALAALKDVRRNG